MFTATSLIMPLPVAPHLLEHENISIVYEFLSRDQVLDELQQAHVVLCVSRQIFQYAFCVLNVKRLCC